MLGTDLTKKSHVLFLSLEKDSVSIGRNQI